MTCIFFCLGFRSQDHLTAKDLIYHQHIAVPCTPAPAHSRGHFQCPHQGTREAAPKTHSQLAHKGEHIAPGALLGLNTHLWICILIAKFFNFESQRIRRKRCVFPLHFHRVLWHTRIFFTSTTEFLLPTNFRACTPAPFLG